MRDVTDVQSQLVVVRFRQVYTYRYGVLQSVGPKIVDGNSRISKYISHRARGNLRFGDRVTPLPYEGRLHDTVPEQINYTHSTGVVNPLMVHQQITKLVFEGRWISALSSAQYLAQTIGGSPVVPQHVIDACENKLLGNIANRKMSITQTLGETLISANTMLAQVTGLLKAVHAFRRKDWKAVRRHLGVDRGISTIDTLSGGWLAWRFGWEPLLLDIINHREAIMLSLTADAPLLTARSTVFDSIDPNSLMQHPNLGMDGQIDRIVEYKASFTISDESAQGLNQLGLSNPLASAWEFIPYSFVVDWFTGMGQFLWHLSADHGVKYLHGYSIVMTKHDYQIVDRQMIFSKFGPGSRCHGKAFERRVHSTLPIPSPRMTLGLDRNKVQVLLALINQRA